MQKKEAVKRSVFDSKKKCKKPEKNPKKVEKPKIRAPSSESESDEEESFCLICLEPFSNSAPNEEWVKCRSCSGWSHEACTDGGEVYTCHNCDSD